MHRLAVEPDNVGKWGSLHPDLDVNLRAVLLVGHLHLAFGNFDQLLSSSIGGLRGAMTGRIYRGEIPEQPVLAEQPKDFALRVKFWRKLIRATVGDGSEILSQVDRTANQVRSAAFVRHDLAHAATSFNAEKSEFYTVNHRSHREMWREIDKLPKTGSSVAFSEKLTPIFGRYENKTYSLDQIFQATVNLEEGCHSVSAYTGKAILSHPLPRPLKHSINWQLQRFADLTFRVLRRSS